MPASTYMANALLDHVFGNTAFPQPTAWWVQLHYGDPGDDGSGSALTIADRRAMYADGTGITAGEYVSTNAVIWASLPLTPDTPITVSHISIWDAYFFGNLLSYGELTTSRYVEAGDMLSFSIGEIIEAVT